MNTLIIILQQSTTASVIEILLLLVVAGLIGYLTAYFYYKSVYTKKINILEDEITGHKKTIDSLTSEIAKLEKINKEKEAEIESLKKPKK